MEFKFYPQTWSLPTDAFDLGEYTSLEQKYQQQSKVSGDEKPESSVFIVKPEASCQGRGIFLTKRIDKVLKNNNKMAMIVQKYIDNPLLMNGYKFDFRIYVLVTSVEPLKIFVFKDGIARFATEMYQSNNYDRLYMHLTNYSINKKNKQFFQQNFEHIDDEMRPKVKRKISEIYDLLKQEGHDTSIIEDEINDILIKTILSV